LHKDLSLLVVDGATGFGNGRVLPAGPLREPVAVGAARCQAAVVIGAAVALPVSLPVLRARLVQGPEIAGLRGKRVLAFAGIAYPDKFFAPLQAAGAEVVRAVPFPDHHPYARRELDELLGDADRLNAIPVTTPKDAVRLPPEVRGRVQVIGVGLAWDDEASVTALLDGVVLSGSRVAT